MIKTKSYPLLLLVFCILAGSIGLTPVTPTQVAHAVTATYYVSPTGKASNDGLSTSSPWSLAKAASSAVAGDNILFMDGTYGEQLIPQNSGTATDPITFKAMNQGKAILTYRYAGYIVKILGKSHITLNGFKLTSHLNSGRWLTIDSSTGTASGVSSNHITLSNNTFTFAAAGWGPNSPVFIRYTDQVKLLNNLFSEAYYGDDMVTFSHSQNLLVEGNNFSKARHSPLNFSYYEDNFNSVNNVVIRNNVLNSQWSRNYSIFPNSKVLVEGNVISEARYGSGNAAATSATYSNQGIYRYNRYIRNSEGALGSAPYPPSVYFFNNTFYNNIFAENSTYAYLLGYGHDNLTKNNFFKNNIFYNNDNNAKNTNIKYFQHAFNTDGTRTISFNQNNFWHGPGVTPNFLGNNNKFEFNATDWNIWSLAEMETMSAAPNSKVPQFINNTNVDPLFEDPSNYNYIPQPGSPMIDGGTNLTEAVGAGSLSTSLTVENPNYFYDGWEIEGEQGDLISVGSAGNRARITHIAYITDPATGVVTSGVLTLDTALTWVDGATVNMAYEGSAPDMGIVEMGATAPGSLQVTTDQFKSVTGTAVPFSAHVIGSFTPVSYSWRFGDGSTGTGSTISHTYSQAGQYMVYSQATDAAGNTISGVTYVIIKAADYLTKPLLYSSFDANDHLFAQLYRHSTRGNEVMNYERIYENRTNGVIHVFYKQGNEETEQLRFANYEPDWNINEFPIVRAKYKVNAGTPLVLAIEAFPIRLDYRSYPIAATASANEPSAAYTLIDDGEWHTIEVDVRKIRDLGGEYAGLNYLRSAGFRTMAAGSEGQEYWIDDFGINPLGYTPPIIIPPTTPTTAINLIDNPGFESGATGWNLWGGSSVVSNNARSGSNSAKVNLASGFAQDITTGVSGNDTYYFEAYGKVDSGQRGEIYVSCLDSTNQVLWQTSMANFTSTAYALRSETFVAPPDTVKIRVWTWKSTTGGNYYLDDFVLNNLSSSTPPPTAVNLVQNAGFESGATGWDLWGGSSVVSSNARSGSNSAAVSLASGFAQDITTDVYENDTYYFEVYGKVDSGQRGEIYVSCYDASNQVLWRTSMANFTSTAYTLRSETFVAPPGTVKIKVWTWKSTTGGNYYVDDFVLNNLSRSI